VFLRRSIQIPAAQQRHKRGSVMRMSMDAEMEACIDNCLRCYRVCEQTKMHCLNKGGEHAAADHLSTLADCAKICATSADFMIRMSRNHAQTCGVCAAICDECAAECERMADDGQMRQCAEACRRCAQSCQQMAGSPAA
jgi:hypothetical protein